MNLFEYTYDLVRQIPKGNISTYGAVARALGDIVASRAVGRMMNQNPDADDMPCFKIVHSDGKLGGFGLGINDKIRRLKEDNISVKDGKIVDFKDVLFEDFKTMQLYLSAHPGPDGVSYEVFPGVTVQVKNQIYGALNPIDENCWVKTELLDKSAWDTNEIVSTYKDNIKNLHPDVVRAIRNFRKHPTLPQLVLCASVLSRSLSTPSAS